MYHLNPNKEGSLNRLRSVIGGLEWDIEVKHGSSVDE